MTAYKRTRRLGRQPLHPFVKSVTLVQVANNWLSLETQGVNIWPEASSIYNVACLAFFRRGVEKVQTNATNGGVTIQGRSRPIGTTFWTDDPTTWPGLSVFNRDRVAVANGAEFFSVAWLRPPDGLLGQPGNPFPNAEDFFSIIQHLAL